MNRQIITIQVGYKGCGKSEVARKIMNLTPKQYEHSVEQFERTFTKNKNIRGVFI